MLFSSPLLTVLTVLTATGIQTVSAHTRLYAVSINGVDQGIGCDELEGDKNKEYIRCPPNTDPVKDWGSKDMACNADGEKEADRWLPVKWGDKITFQWYAEYPFTASTTHHIPPLILVSLVHATNQNAQGLQKTFQRQV